MLFQDLSDFKDILPASDKGCRQNVIPHLNAEQDIRSVYFADIRHGQNRPRHIDTLVVGDKAAVFHAAYDLLPPDFLYCHLD